MPDSPLVCIVTWNRPDLCIRTIEGFLRQDAVNRVVVFDNGSTDSNAAFLSRHLAVMPQVSVVRLTPNTGYAGAASAAIEHWLQNSESDVCVISTHDALPAPGAVRDMVRVLQTSSGAGVCFPLRPPAEEGRWHPLRGTYHCPLNPERVQGTAQVEVLYAPAPCVAIRREAALAGAGIDRRLFAYHEECDLALSARRAGFSAVLVPGAVVENVEIGRSWARSAAPVYLMARNSVLLARKYGGSVLALMRATIILLAAGRSWLAGSGRTIEFSSRARVLGVFDALRGRFGPPPASVLARGEAAPPIG